MNALIGREYKVLDHGFVRIEDLMGSDESIARTARVSTGSQSKGETQDAKLIDYLMRHNHTSPFEFAEIILKIKMPIFVARQWIRHRTANVNEWSGRYSVLPNECYVPEREQVKPQTTSNNQGREGELDSSIINFFLMQSTINNDYSFECYDAHIKDGVARELARINLPLSTYTVIYWKIDAHNLMRFIQLRNDPHAQYEIRVYAEVLNEILRTWLPLTHASFMRRVRRDTFAQEHLWTDDDYERLIEREC